MNIFITFFVEQLKPNHFLVTVDKRGTSVVGCWVMKVKFVHQKRSFVLARVLFVVVVVLKLLLLFVVLFSSAKVEASVVAALAVFNNIWQPCKADSNFRLSFVDFVDGIRRFVAPPTYRFDVFFGQMIENVAYVEVLFDRSSKKLEAGVASEFLNLETKKKIK